jgi:hypothetical protein
MIFALCTRRPGQNPGGDGCGGYRNAQMATWLKVWVEVFFFKIMDSLYPASSTPG